MRIIDIGRAACAAAALVALAGASRAADEPNRWPAAPSAALQAAREAAERIGRELARLCPVADPADEAALGRCRSGLRDGSTLRARLQPIVLWGRQRDPQRKLADSTLTQFAPEVLAGMYLPLFMFDGGHREQWVESERMVQMRFNAAFRNRLPPGQFPYPFWHEDEKWAMYEGTRELLLWWDPATARVAAAQFTVHSSQPAIARIEHHQPAAFDGHWMWTDAQGSTQPKATLFDGLFSAANPNLQRLDASYRRFALRLREGQCEQCHVPNNPIGSRRLVLLQTPAHAAGEIQRLLDSVRKDKMPLDEAWQEEPLAPPLKAALLEEGEAFAAALDAARRWELRRTGQTTAAMDPVPARP